MRDPILIEKRLAHIVACVEKIRTLARPDRIPGDPVQQAFVERMLQTAIQAMIDVASAIATEKRLREPGTNAQLFDLLVEAGWLPAAQAEVCRNIVGFRNVVVHDYLEIDPAIVRKIAESHLDDLLAFVRIARTRLAE